MAWKTVARGATVGLIAVGGIWLRFWAARRGSNWDMECWQITSRLYGEGGVTAVYAGTNRYNYGPIWAHVVGILGMVVGYENGLRYAVTAVLTTADLVIARLLWRSQGAAAGAAYFLCPVVVLLSGFHRQHEPLALAIALGGLALLVRGDEQQRWKVKVAGLLVLGLSLSSKHIIFAFPLWLARHQRGIWRILVLAIPPAVFALMFVPHLAAWEGIRANVIDYKSWQNFIAWGLLPEMLRVQVTPWQVFGGALLLGAVFAPRDPVRALALYCLVLVAASPSIANQYLTLVGLAWAVNRSNLPLALAVIAGAIFIASDPNGFGIAGLRLWSADPDLERPAAYRTIVVLLLASLCYRAPFDSWRVRGR